MTEQLYLGGYTKRTNDGIYSVTLTMDGRFKGAKRLIAEENPTYFAVSSDGEHLYSLSTKDGRPGVAHYQRKNETFQEVGRVTFFHTNGCYLSLDEARQLLYVANYHDGKFAIIQILADGHLKLIATTTHSGHGPRPEQEAPHCHFLHTTPDDRYLLGCDLGTDRVISYCLDETQQPEVIATYRPTPGTGPRHLAFHPNGQYVYLLGELSCTLDICRYADGCLTRVQRLPLPHTRPGQTGAAALRVTQDGRFLYVSVRGSNELHVLKITNNGATLTHQQRISTGGDGPRDFNFNRDERYLIVGHQNSPLVTLFRRDPISGTLIRMDSTLPLDEIVCVVRA